MRCGIALVALAVAVAVTAADGPGFQREELADGVWLYRAAGTAGETAVETDDAAPINSLVVEQSGGLVVIEAQPDPGLARGLLARLDADFDSPVRYLVLSHPQFEGYEVKL